VNLPIVYIALIFADALPISAFIKPLNNLLNIWLILVNHLLLSSIYSWIIFLIPLWISCFYILINLLQLIFFTFPECHLSWIPIRIKELDFADFKQSVFY